MKWLFLLLGLFANASASILIKIGVNRDLALQLSLEDLLNLSKSWPLLLGIFLYGIAFFLYIVSLSKFPLNLVHPTMTAGSIALVGLFSYFCLQEKFSVLIIIGYCLILAGVFFVFFTET